jgi:hypothetical protein
VNLEKNVLPEDWELVVLFSLQFSFRMAEALDMTLDEVSLFLLG